jgi:hypothetical protein
MAIEAGQSLLPSGQQLGYHIGCKDAVIVILDCRASREQYVDCHEAGTKAWLIRLILRYEYVAMVDGETKCRRKALGAFLNGVQFKYTYC